MSIMTGERSNALRRTCDCIKGYTNHRWKRNRCVRCKKIRKEVRL